MEDTPCLLKQRIFDPNGETRINGIHNLRDPEYTISFHHVDNKLERQVNIGQSKWQDDDSQWKEYVRHARKFDRTYKVSMIARNCPEELNRKALRDHIEITTSIHEFSQFSLKDQYVGIFNTRQNHGISHVHCCGKML